MIRWGVGTGALVAVLVCTGCATEANPESGGGSPALPAPVELSGMDPGGGAGAATQAEAPGVPLDSNVAEASSEDAAGDRGATPPANGEPSAAEPMAWGEPTGEPTAAPEPEVGAQEPATGGEPTSGVEPQPQGEPEDTFAAGLHLCQESCATDADCLSGYACQQGTCVYPFSTCEADADCVALYSGWATPCSHTDECPGQVCILVDGGGRCATAPGPYLACETIGMQEVAQQELPSGNAVAVCANLDAICTSDAYCLDPCESDGDCLSPEYPKCEVDTGRCRCVAGSCETNASVCHEGMCACQADDDCVFGMVDVCYNGVCGCSDVSICDAGVHPGTTPVCAAWD